MRSKIKIDSAEVSYMKREYAEAYVRWYDEKTVNLNMLFTETKICTFFAVIAVIAACMSRRAIVAIIMAVLVFAHGITAVVLKKTVHELTYAQQFLVTGYSAMFGSVVFFLMSMMIVEGTGFWAGYYIVLPVMWVLVVCINLWTTWNRARKGYYARKESPKVKKGVVGVSIFFPLAGIMVAKVTAPFLGQYAVRTIAIWVFFLMSAAFTIGCPNFLKTYLVQKYEIHGASVEAYYSDGEKKKPLLLRICLVVLVGALIFIGIPSVVGIIAHYLSL